MYAQAVQYHSQTAHLLVHYRHIAVFKKIEDECKVVMDEVAKKIREKMYRESVCILQHYEACRLWVFLGALHKSDCNSQI